MGHTHKWNVFVRSGDQQHKLDKIVKKVVFILHETFKNPMRTCMNPPYYVKESGYGQFEFPIEIYFNGTDSKFSTNYYLELPALNNLEPLSRVRSESIEFKNPSPEFRKILIASGAKHKVNDASHLNSNSMSSKKSPLINTTIINENIVSSKPGKKNANTSQSSAQSSNNLNQTKNNSSSSILNTSNSSTSSSSSNISPEKKVNGKKVGYNFNHT